MNTIKVQYPKDISQLNIWSLSCEDIWTILRQLPIVQKLVTIPQNPKYHAEGNVLQHIDLCMQYWFSQKDQCDFSKLGYDLDMEIEVHLPIIEECKKAMTIVVALHDLGKLTRTTETETGIHHYGHPIESMRIAQQLLFYSDIPFGVKYEIIKLIQYHDYFIGWSRIKNIHDYLMRVHLAVHVPTLLLFCEIDNHGRIYKDQKSVLEGFEILKLCFQEWSDQNLFPKNKQAEVLLARKKLHDLTYVPHEEYNGKFIVLAGLPGSGKSYYANRLRKDAENQAQIHIVSYDQMRDDFGISRGDFKKEKKFHLETRAKEEILKYLRLGETVILDNVNVSENTRAKWLQLALNYSAYTQIIYIEKNWKTMFEQNHNRQHVVPDDVIQQMLRYHLCYPEQGEAHCVQFEVDQL